MHIAEFASPLQNSSGRIDFWWRESGAALPIELLVAGGAGVPQLQAEIWTNADRTDAPTAFRALPMRRSGERAGAALFRLELPVSRIGNFRATGRISADRGATWRWAGDSGLPDLKFRPRDPALDDLAIELVSVPHVNRRAGRSGTFADLLEPGSPLDGSGYSLHWLADQGSNAIWLLPVFEVSEQARVADSDATASPYAVRDFFAVNPALARAARGLTGAAAQDAARTEFGELIATAHRLGMRVLLDVALNHVGVGHRFADLFVSVDDRGREQRVVRRGDFSQLGFTATGSGTLEQQAPWLYGSHADFPLGARGAAAIAPGGWFEWTDARQLNHGRRRTGFRDFVEAPTSDQHAALQGWLGRVLRYWAVDMGVDGFRIDHLAGLPRRMLEHAFNELQNDVDRHRPGTRAILVGEDYDTAHETQHWVDVLQAGWLDEWLDDRTPQRLEQIVDHPWFCHLLGLGSHDQDRLLQRLDGDAVAARCLLGLLQLVGGPTLEVAGDALAEVERLPLRRDCQVAALEQISDAGRELASSLGHWRRLRHALPALRGRQRRWLRRSDGTSDPAIVGLVRGAPEHGEPDVLVVANLDCRARRRARFALDRATRTRLRSGREIEVDLAPGEIQVTALDQA